MDYDIGLRVDELVGLQVVRTPEAAAVVTETERLTYEELSTRAARVAARLRALGVGPDCLVGVYLERTAGMVAGLLGILQAGGAYVPLDPKYPRARIAFILADAQPVVVLTQAKLRTQLPPTTAQVVCLEDLLDATMVLPPVAAAVRATVTNLAYVIYTSGSTGQPKGVAIEHRNAVNFIHWARSAFTDAELAGVLAATSICFDLSVFELFVTLSWGGKVILAEHALQLPQLAARTEVTLVNTVPSAIAELVHGGLPATVQTVNLAGEPLATALVDRLYALPQIRKVNDLYGPTETTTYSTFTLRQKGLPATIGRPLANTQVYVLDETRQPVPVGVAGELYIGGAGVARGYLQRPELTAEKFIANPFLPGGRLYRTGDLVRWRADGQLEFIGRRDQQVKIRGFRIELGEIEAVLAAHPAVREGAVVARDNAAGEKQLIAYLTLRGPTPPTVGELRAHLLQKLPDYMVPAAFVTLPVFPLTPNGKLDRKALPAPTETRRETFAAPTTPTEKTMAKIWGELLGRNPIGVHDNYFELGGHSLLAVRLVFRLRETFQVELPVKAVAEHPTIAALSRVVAATAKTAPAAIPVETATPPPATFGQEQLWFLDQLEPGGSAYNVPLVLQLRGALNRAALQQSLNYLLQRHAALRTSFAAEHGIPHPVVAPFLALTLTSVSLEAFPAQERAAELQRQLQLAAARPFDLGHGPLLRAELFALNSEEHCLLLTLHHIVFDGWSVDILLRELTHAYSAYTKNTAPQLPPLPIQYHDFARWQRQHLNPNTTNAHLRYWQQQLQNTPTILELPTDKMRPPVADHVGAHQKFVLSAELSEALRGLAKQQGTTFFVTLLATFQTLLHRFTGQQTLLVGSPMSGRVLPDSENLIGLFMNALPLKADFSENPKFTELLRQIHQTVWEAQDHQALPFEKLVQEFQPQRDLSRNPIFQTTFVLESAAESGMQMDGVHLEWEFLRTPTVKFDLTMTLTEKRGQVEGIFEYATGIFEAATITRLLEYYQNLLAAIVANPEEKVANLRLLADAERHQLLTKWNDTAADYPREKFIHQLFEAQVEKTPDAMAVVCDGQQLTYRELNRRANQLAHHLRTLGIGPDSLGGIYIKRSVEMMVGLLGILKAGGAYVPLDIKNPKSRLQQQLKHAKVLVTQMELLPQLPEFAGKIVCLDREKNELGRLPETNPQPLGTSENLAYVIYTSGSTGAPKGVAIRHRNLVNYTHFIYQRLGLEKILGGLKFASVSSIAADLGNTCIFPALISGGSLHVVNADLAVNPEGFAHYAALNEIDVLKITPSHLAALITAKNSAAILPRRFLILGGEALTPQLVTRVRALGGSCRIINHYGPTETTVGSLTLDEKDFGTEPLATVPVGRPIANTQAYILDANFQPVPFGLRGQLCIGGDGIAKGYYQNPQLTAEKFIRNPFSENPSAQLYCTGDLARYLPDGRIEFLGRKDQQVKIRGFRIELGEIEAAIKDFSGVGECILTVQEHELGDSWLVAYVVPAHPHFPPNTKELRDFLKQKLPDYMIPAAFVDLEKLPLTPNGKLDRKALPAPDWFATEDARTQKFDWPRTPLELQILLIWQRILNLKTISISDNFFDLGGHSLLAVRLVSEINKSLSQSLSIPVFFQHPTIESLAQLLQQENQNNSEPKLVPLQPGDPARALFFLDASMGQCRLAQLLDTEIASFATIVPLPREIIQAASRNETKHLPSVEKLAAYHTALIQKHQPTGACLLAGHSFGGLLAFEVAHQLQQEGREVEMIFLLDSWAKPPAWWLKLKALTFARAFESIKFRARHWWSKKHPAANHKKIAAAEPAPTPPALEEANQPIGDVSWEILERIYRNARKNYRLRPLASRAVVFRAQESEMAFFHNVDPQLGWDGLLTRGLVVLETPGDHFSLLKRPHLLTLVEHFKKHLKPDR
jgi:amino acid adenylation domain-containing protein